MLETENETMNTQSHITTTMVSEEDRLQYLQQLQDETTIYLTPAMVFIIIIAVLGLVGNSTVLFVYSRKFQKNPTRILIMTIAALDLVSNVCAIPGDVYDMFHYWDFNNAPLCRLRMFVSAFATLSAAFALVAVAVIRYRKVCHPHDWQITITQAKILSAFVALLGVLSSIPYAITNGRQTKKTPRSDIFGFECNEDDYYKDTVWPLLNNGFFFLLFCSCCIPLIVMYVRIGITAWKSDRLHRSFKSDSEGGNQSNTTGFKQPRAAKKRKMSIQALLHRSSIDNSDDANVFDVRNKQSETNRRLDTCFEICTSHITQGGGKVNKPNGKDLIGHSGETTDRKELNETVVTIENTTKNNQESSDCKSAAAERNKNLSGSSAFPSFIFVTDCSRDVDIICEDQKGITNKGTLEGELWFLNNGISSSSPDDLGNVKLTIIDNNILIAPPRIRKRGPGKEDAEYHRQKYRQSAPEFCTNWGEFEEVRSHSQGLRVLSLINPTEYGVDSNGAIGETDVDAIIPSTSSEISQENSDALLKATSSTEPEYRRSATSEWLAGERTQSHLVNFGFEGNDVINKEGIRIGDIENIDVLFTAGQSTDYAENIPTKLTNSGFKEILKRMKHCENKKSEKKRNKLSYLGRTTAILILISTVYVIGFLPYLALSFFSFLAPDTYDKLNITELSLYNLFLRFYLINSAANPIIYSLCGGRFRRECVSLLRCNSRGTCK